MPKQTSDQHARGQHENSPKKHTKNTEICHRDTRHSCARGDTDTHTKKNQVHTQTHTIPKQQQTAGTAHRRENTHAQHTHKKQHHRTRTQRGRTRASTTKAHGRKNSDADGGLPAFAVERTAVNNTAHSTVPMTVRVVLNTNTQKKSVQIERRKTANCSKVWRSFLKETNSKRNQEQGLLKCKLKVEKNTAIKAGGSAATYTQGSNDNRARFAKTVAKPDPDKNNNTMIADTTQHNERKKAAIVIEKLFFANPTPKRKVAKALGRADKIQHTFVLVAAKIHACNFWTVRTHKWCYNQIINERVC